MQTPNRQHEFDRSQAVCFDSELIERYGGRGPRYTSYPTAMQFDDSFTAEQYLAHAATSNDTPRPLSLYVHIPFCESLCYYCACNKIVTRNQNRIQSYLQHLNREIAMQSELFDASRKVEQLHLGGGTPTYLSDQQLCELMEQLHRRFNFETSDHREFSIEVDPRSVKDNSVALLADLGFNRLSLGIQDFDPAVQMAVNRIQTRKDVASIVDNARHHEFKSISFDLIYGLPHQSVTSFERTLDLVLTMQPDRLAVYNYAHLPARFKGQRMINSEHIPNQASKLEILHLTIQKLINADYCYIGADHFARPDDDLVLAQNDGTLQRNFQGYSTHGECHLIGLGASAISSVNNAISQNAITTTEYEQLIGSGKLAIKKGVEVHDDDRLRAQIIQALMCHSELAFKPFEIANDLTFADYFADELTRLRQLHEDGLVVLGPDSILITPKGRLLLRSIAMVFDRYLSSTSPARRYSRTI